MICMWSTSRPSFTPFAKPKLTSQSSTQSETQWRFSKQKAHLPLLLLAIISPNASSEEPPFFKSSTVTSVLHLPWTLFSARFIFLLFALSAHSFFSTEWIFIISYAGDIYRIACHSWWWTFTICLRSACFWHHQRSCYIALSWKIPTRQSTGVCCYSPCSVWSRDTRHDTTLTH